MIFYELKNKITLLKKMRLSVSNVIELFCRQGMAQRGLPMELQTPNKKTMKAIRASRSGKGWSFSTAEELLKDLGI
jgi:addiction module RelB/DinJ family antitoxin